MLSNRKPKQMELFPMEEIDLQPVGASARQVGGEHYREMVVQPWDAMKAWMTPAEFKGFLKGNAIKYLARELGKGGADDIRKAQHYIDKLVEEL